MKPTPSRQCAPSAILRKESNSEGVSSPNIPPNFDRLAAVYRWMELASFGPFLQLCRCAFLSELGSCRRALIFGDGDGRFTARLLRSNGDIFIDAVDASRAMLRSLVRRAGKHGQRVRTEQVDARAWAPCYAVSETDGDSQDRYDLVVTHFFLDCLTTEEVAVLAQRVRSAVCPGAMWIVSDFAIPTNAMAVLARLVVAALYRAFGVLTGLRVRQLPDHRHVFEKAGLQCVRKRAFLGGLLVSELWKQNV